MINHQLTLFSGVWGALAVSAIMAGLLIVMFIDSITKIGRWFGSHLEALRERRRREQAEFNARRAEAERLRAEQEEAALREEEARKRAEEAARMRHEAEEAERNKEEARDTHRPETPAAAEPQQVAEEQSTKAPEYKEIHSRVEEDHTDLFMQPSVPAERIAEIPSVADDEPLFDPDTFDAPVAEQADDVYLFNNDREAEDMKRDDAEPDYQEEPYHDEDEFDEPLTDIPEDDETQAEMVVEKPVIEQCTEISQPSFYDPTAELSHFTFPSLDLLRDVAYSTDSVDATEMEENKVRITKTLGDYGIPISHIHATVGPTVTLYEIIPAEGVRIAKIKRLEDDIAMSLAALGIRIIAPIPGKGTIGIEVPNKDPQVVSIRSILSSRKFQESNMELPMALGCTISNDVFMADLAKMPHLLVAGATGMGKSVGLNTIIASLLYKKHPAELKFVLIDPKMVEFSLYASLERHYLAKLPDEEDAIITDPNKVVATLNSLCIEMDNRYALLKMASCRNIKEYNERIQRGNLMAKHNEGHRYLPYIVVIVDEFADLIMTAGKEVETPIARIAQKARAVGIHMILATQRPSTNVITGVIKANFPGRIAFRVFQMVDSRTILDRPGANQLIGRGDMLFSNNGKIERVQCAFIDTPEVEAICDAISRQVGMETYPLPEYVPETEGVGGLSGNPSDRDPLFGDAARYVVQTDTASTSSLQ
ncbi:MAG: DNA translocase FtsK, partial [Duncaniella sp.]|nr:DNA translocase FtsK [Duncaniella sp.]